MNVSIIIRECEWEIDSDNGGGDVVAVKSRLPQGVQVYPKAALCSGDLVGEEVSGTQGVSVGVILLIILGRRCRS